MCGVALQGCEGKNSILCFVRTPTYPVRRCPVQCWAWQETIKVREINPCLHLFRSVQSFNKPAEGSSSSHLFPQVVPWIYRIKFGVSWALELPELWECAGIISWEVPQNQSSGCRLRIDLSELRAVLAALFTGSPGNAEPQL